MDLLSSERWSGAIDSLTALSLTAASSVALAFLRKRQNGISDDGTVNRKAGWQVAVIVLMLVLFSGLRTGYNDTYTYISVFRVSPAVGEFLADRANLDLLHNPLFYFYMSAVRTLTADYHVFLMLSAAITVPLMVRFIARVTEPAEFPLSMLLFMTLGTYVFTMAAIKQSLAMAVLCPAIIALRDRKYLRFFVFVAVAALIHTYAALFFILPFFGEKPWHARSFLLILGSMLVTLNFSQTISSVLAYADSIGKSISAEEVFDGNRMNVFRVAVYSVVPAASLLFRKRLEPVMDRTQAILINMSICSLAFMLPGTVNGANMFGRIAAYFELGAVCVMPWIIDTVFDRRSARLVRAVCAVCFIAFALYDLSDFNYGYSAITLRQFIGGLIG